MDVQNIYKLEQLIYVLAQRNLLLSRKDTTAQYREDGKSDDPGAALFIGLVPRKAKLFFPRTILAKSGRSRRRNNLNSF